MVYLVLNSLNDEEVLIGYTMLYELIYIEYILYIMPTRMITV